MVPKLRKNVLLANRIILPISHRCSVANVWDTMDYEKQAHYL